MEITPLAASQVEGMRGRSLAAFWAWEEDLAARGCAAMGYRLTGEVIETLCCRHLSGQWRALVAFGDDTTTIVLVARHDDRDPRNIYDLLYELVGHEPEPGSGRNKPSCCDPATGQAPAGDEDLIALLSRRVRDLMR